LYYTFRLFSSQLLAIWRVVVQGVEETKATKAFRAFRGLSLALSPSKGVSPGSNRPLALAE